MLDPDFRGRVPSGHCGPSPHHWARQTASPAWGRPASAALTWAKGSPTAGPLSTTTNSLHLPGHCPNALSNLKKPPYPCPLLCTTPRSQGPSGPRAEAACQRGPPHGTPPVHVSAACPATRTGLIRCRPLGRSQIAATTNALKIGACKHQGRAQGPSPQKPRTHLHLKFIADVASIQLRADKLELPVKQGPGVPVAIAQEVQDLLVAGHGVHTCGWT